MFWEPKGSLWMAWEGVMEAPREFLGGLGHLLGAAWSCSDPGLHFPKKCCKIIIFYSVWEPGRVFGTIGMIGRIGRKCNMAGSSDPRFFTPKVRMTVVRLRQLPQMMRPLGLFGRLGALVPKANFGESV